MGYIPSIVLAKLPNERLMLMNTIKDCDKDYDYDYVYEIVLIFTSSLFANKMNWSFYDVGVVCYWASSWGSLL